MAAQIGENGIVTSKKIKKDVPTFSQSSSNFMLEQKVPNENPMPTINTNLGISKSPYIKVVYALRFKWWLIILDQSDFG